MVKSTSKVKVEAKARQGGGWLRRRERDDKTRKPDGLPRRQFGAGDYGIRDAGGLICGSFMTDDSRWTASCCRVAASCKSRECGARPTESSRVDSKSPSKQASMRRQKQRKTRAEQSTPESTPNNRRLLAESRIRA